MRAVGQGLRWLGLNVLVALACAFAAYAVLWVLGVTILPTLGVRTIVAADYIGALVFVAMAWPLYMLTLWIAVRSRPDRFRRWAILLIPLLAIMLGILNLLVNQPEIQAVYLFYLCYALAVRPPEPAVRGQGALGAQIHSHL